MFVRKHYLFDYISIIHLQTKVRVSIRFRVRVRVGNRVRGRVRVRNTIILLVRYTLFQRMSWA